MGIASPPHDDPLAWLAQSPRHALQLARAHYDLARAANAAAAQAETALTLALVLNTLGEFQTALPLCDFAAAEFARRGAHALAALAECQAAWANSFLGKLTDTLETLTRIQNSCADDLLQAQCDWIRARLLRDQGHYPQAQVLLDQVRARFQSAHLPLEAARCERDLAHTLLLGDHDAAPLLQNARQTFAAAQCLIDLAWCDYLAALAQQRKNRYREAIQIYQTARQHFSDLGAPYFAAGCDLELGICYRQANRFDESLRASHQARDYFLAHGARAGASASAINLANTYYSLNRYDDALPLYTQVAQDALADGRRLRASIVNENMALIYTKQGRFAQALDLHQRALQNFSAENQQVFAAISRVNLASAYRQLGQFADALEQLQQARSVFAQHQQWLYLVECACESAEIHLALRATAPAVAQLDQARAVCVAQQLAAWVAVCDRLLAQAALQTGAVERAAALLAASRAVFLAHTQIVDAALCELAAGELHLRLNQVEPAQEYFLRARATLAPGFPDQSWRADYGLGRCAAFNGAAASALEYYLSAAQTIAHARALLATEQLSNTFFLGRQAVYADALALALDQQAPAAALQVIEASKARTCLTLLQNRGWRLRRADGDPYVTGLAARERALRYQLDALRQQVALQTEQPGEPLRGASDRAVAASALQELNALSQAYESVVSQLRLATTGLAGVSAPPPFALAEFRRAAHAAFGADWTALDYHLTQDELVIVIVRPAELEIERKKLSAYDRAILDKCASAAPDLRELIYRGTLRGAAAPSPGENYLRHLQRLLLPRTLGETLIIAPHQALHTLPFHALKDAAGYLIERHTLVYTPSLQIMQQLLAEPATLGEPYPLVVGLSQFDAPLPALPATANEVATIEKIFAGRGEYLREENATRQYFFDQDAAENLRRFDLIHLATHAILERAAPHQSRVALHDGALTALDILDLALNARVVMLSACQTALGEGGAGDEWIGLARAFFYAGARALVASLWHVEDGSVVELIAQFYGQLAHGAGVAAALRSAQIEMIRQGYAPYHWAPFTCIGRA